MQKAAMPEHCQSWWSISCHWLTTQVTFDQCARISRQVQASSRQRIPWASLRAVSQKGLWDGQGHEAAQS